MNPRASRPNPVEALNAATDADEEFHEAWNRAHRRPRLIVFLIVLVVTAVVVGLVLWSWTLPDCLNPPNDYMPCLAAG